MVISGAEDAMLPRLSILEGQAEYKYSAYYGTRPTTWKFMNKLIL
jgi:hypothetical protein